MSLMAINRTAKKYGWLVGAVMAVFMVGGVVMTGLGNNLGGGANPMAGKAPQEKPVAKIGERDISQPELDRFTENLLKQQNYPTPPPEQMDAARLQVLEVFKQQQALLAVAKTAGVTATDSDLAAERDKQWATGLRPSIAQQLGLAADADDSKVAAGLSKLGNGATIALIKQQYLPDEEMRLSVIKRKLADQYKTQIAADDDAVRRSLSDMTVRHILVKFGAGALPEAQARTKAEKLLAAVKADPTKMGDLAKQNTDDVGSKAKSGVYEWKPSDRASIVPEFAAALDTLKPGTTYPDLVRVEDRGYSGFHIIRLESVKPGKEFPKDYDASKTKYLGEFVATRSDRRLKQAVDAAVPSVPVTLLSPQLQSEQALEDATKKTNEKEKNASYDKALALLDTIKKEDDPLGIVPLKKARIFTEQKKNKDAIAAYTDALSYHQTADAHLALANAYIQDKQMDKAKTEVAAAEALGIFDFQKQMQVSSLYRAAGDKAKADAAQKKLMEMIQRMQAAQPPAGAGAPGAPAAPKPAPQPAKK